MFSTLILKTFILAAIITLAAAKTYNVMVINFDPIFDVEGKKVKQHELYEAWNDPNELMTKFIKDMSEISYGNVNYNIVKNIELDEFPRNFLGESYTREYYYNTLMTAINETDYQYWKYEGWEDYGRTFDYVYYFHKYDAFKMINDGTIDEVWFFTGPFVGVTLNETTMIGKNAFFVNGEPIYRRGSRNFIAYGFNYERGVGEMLENAGHREEFIMDNVFGTNYSKDYSDYNDWEKFTAHEKVSPGNSGVGNIHFAPNSETDYDWGNRTPVMSNCANWLNYPDLSGEPKEYTCSEWGNGDIREHHKWWFKHLPHAKGKNAETDKYNNWWIYFTLDYINDPPADIPEPPETSSIEECTFEKVSSVNYTGKPIKPSVTIKCGSKKLKKGTDYTVIYKENVDVGKARIKITGINDYTGKKTITFKIIPQTKVDVSLDNDTVAFKGCNIKPQPNVTFGDIKLKPDVDYTLSYKNNKYVGTGIITTTLQGNYKGKIVIEFKIVPRNIKELKFSTIKDQVYSGKPLKPSFTITQYSLVLKSGKDYTVSYINNTKPGKAKIIINGKGNYTGRKTLYFNIKIK